ncbi:MAG TPA: hypothetical protein VHJ77_15795 [Vicinamibacterales bacterium]|jgi:hypothetical protein|nr:hypothetical protein [Vicinamibacterales bacterium]
MHQVTRLSLVVIFSSAAALAAVRGCAVRSQELKPPPGWKVQSDKPTDKPAYYVEMPPGWHMTTGAASILYDPAYVADGRFAIETEIFLFPGDSQDGYGLFTGGKELDGGAATYTAFLLRRDGSAGIAARTGGQGRVVRDWVKHDAILPGDQKDSVKNVLRIVAEAADVTFEVNGKPVLTLPRGDLAIDGTFGFRAGDDINVHVSRLDLTRPLAPPRKRAAKS